MRQTLGSPELTLEPAFTADDILGDPYEYPAVEQVRWDIGMGCMVQVEHEANEDQPLRIRIVVGPDFPAFPGHDLRAITADQLRQFACRLIALAEHADRAHQRARGES